MSGGRSDRLMARGVSWPCFNTTAEEIPPFGCMRISGSEANGNALVIRVAKPDTQSAAAGGYSSARFCFNGGTPIPASKFGEAFLAFPLLARVASTTPAIDQTVGPVASSWYIGSSSGNKLWRVSAIDEAKANYVNSTNRTVLLTPNASAGALLYKATLSTDVSSSSATADIYTLESSPSLVASSQTIRDYSGIFAGVKSGSTALVEYQDGVYHIVNASCPFTY